MTKTMTESLTVPTFTFMDEFDASSIFSLQKTLKSRFPNLTLLPFILKALSLSLIDNPHINSVIDPSLDNLGYINYYTIKKNHNFSIAIDSKDGLTCPVLREINNKSIK